jgi:predicted Zn finger-like uncharacterized protein
LRDVIIECPNCRSKYQYDEQRFEGKPSKKIKCSRCQQIFEIQNPANAKSASPAADKGDATLTPRDRTLHSRPIPPPDTTEQSPIPPPTGPQLTTPQLPKGKRLSLAIIGGPDAGSVYRIQQPRTTIGRAGADLTLNDTEASRQHAVIEVFDTTYTLADLGSTNGTLVSGDKITNAVELTDKSEFVVGASTLMLIVTDE